jgi:hypothetical protein
MSSPGRCSGLAFSPEGQWMKVPADRTVETLREAFQRWGLPGRLRVDNGHPWGSTGDLPTELELWLMGLGVETVHNPPARPQANGVVERSQEIGQRWSDAVRCGSAAEVQARLEEMDSHQREGFPDPARSRLSLFPKLAHSGRPYAAEDEPSRWEEAEMRRRLAEYVVVRQINSRGLISVYGRNHYVGKRNAGQSAYVRLDIDSGDWLFELTSGLVIGRTAAGLSRETILSRQVTARHPH